MLRGTVTLEELLHNATNPDNPGPDMVAVEKFAEKIIVEADGARTAVRLLAQKIQSMHEWEAMQALHVLEYCMKYCEDAGFVSEVAKFRFLNELIKLVSPKYLGNRTPPSVKTRVLEILYTWTCVFPTETKIQEAYDMLRKQGVVTEDHVPSCCQIVPPRQPDKTSVFEDDEKSRLLRRLLQSKHPDDLQAANRLIKNMVREDERRSERQSKVTSTLEQVQNNSQLLSEMLAHYDKNGTSTADVELMTELKQACEQLRPGLSRMAEECGEQDSILTDILQAGDDLSKVLENFERVIIRGEPPLPKSGGTNQASLLDLTSPLDAGVPSHSIDSSLSNMSVSEAGKNVKSDADQLREVFSSASSVVPSPVTVNTVFPILQGSQSLPAPLMPVFSEPSCTMQPMPGPKQNTPLFSLNPATDKNTEKVFSTRNASKPSPSNDPLKSLDLDFLVQSKLNESLVKKNELCPEIEENKRHSSGDETLLDVFGDSDDVPKLSSQNSSQSHLDDALLEIDKPESVSDVDPLGSEPEITPAPVEVAVPSQENNATLSTDCKALLADLHVELSSIKPSGKAPITVLDQADGIAVTLHIAQNSPRPGVSVIVISIQSKVSQPISNLMVQAVIPNKACKLKLQPPSSSDLGAFSPFLPPPAATQLLLIANPSKVSVSVKFMVSYIVDEDSVTEMGEVENLPL